MVYCHQMSPIATKHCLIAAASQSSTVKLIDLKSGSATHTLKGHRRTVLTLAWSTKDEFLIATGRFVPAIKVLFLLKGLFIHNVL